MVEGIVRALHEAFVRKEGGPAWAKTLWWTVPGVDFLHQGLLRRVVDFNILPVKAVVSYFRCEEWVGVRGW